MRRFGILIVLSLVLAPVSLLADDESKKADSKPGVIPVFSFDRAFTEVPLGDDFLFGSSGSESFQQLLDRLKKARDDKQVQGIVFLGNSTSLGRAQVEEVRQVMKSLRDADKDIYVHAESLSMRSYVLYSGATKISVVPTGDLWLTGIGAESMHLRGLLEKIGVEPDYLTCGAYKSAAEMFTRKKPSPEAEENINWLLDGLYESYVDLIAAGREVPAEKAREWIDKGLFSAESAKQLGVIDSVEFRHDFVADLKAKYGEKTKIDKKYAKKKQADIDFSTPFGIMKFYAELFAGSTRAKSSKDAVAIVYVEGPILAGKSDPNMFPFGSQGIAYSTPIRNALDKAAEDDSIKAVVLRVNSPGGSAVGSEIILQATRRVKEKKPLVVSMGDVAGSGGYYVACCSDTIFAEPSTITASIGVVGGKLVTQDMWNKIGVNFESYERGESAGILAARERFSDSEREALQSWMDEIYGVFKGHIKTIRGDRLKKDLDEMAGGRVFTGRQALDLGLVDQMGGLNDAVAYIAKDAGLKEYEVRIVPRPKNFVELLRESLSGDEGESQRLSLSSVATQFRKGSTITELALPYLRGIDPARMDCVHDALWQLDILHDETVSLPMPILNLEDR